MSKAVMLSLIPRWVKEIESGQKTDEIRKTRPNQEVPFRCLMYCTQADRNDLWGNPNDIYKNRMKVVGEFICDRIEEHESEFCLNKECYLVDSSEHGTELCSLLRHSRLTCDELRKYIRRTKKFYAWHISQLKMYDKPKELSEFYRYCGDNPNCDKCECFFEERTEEGYDDQCCSMVEGYKFIKRPPQSWYYVEVDE